MSNLRYPLIIIAILSFLFISDTAVIGISPATDLVKILPEMVMPEEAKPWALFDLNTETSYTLSGTSWVEVRFRGTEEVSRISIYGSASCRLNVYSDDGKPIPSLSGLDLSTLNMAWNNFNLRETIRVAKLFFEFIPKGDTAGIRELEIWGIRSVQDGASTVTIQGISLPQQLQSILSLSLSHIIEIPASPEELSISEGNNSSITFHLAQNPAIFKRAFIMYEGYNLPTPVSIARRINDHS